MMKPIRTEQPLDNETNEVISGAMQNPVVLKTLMQHFSNTELLQLSLVNKLWNHEAKSFIRDTGIFPTFNSNESTCVELKAFTSDVRQMDVVPFSGMNIQVFQSHLPDFLGCASRRFSLEGAQLDPSYHVLLDRLPLKRLSLHINKNSASQKNCQSILLAKKMLRHFAEVIEELSINAQHQQFIQDYSIPDLSFRRLKTLKITGSPKERYGWERDFVKELVSRAPNLERLETCGSIRFMDEILEGSSTTVVVPSAGLDPFDTELPESQFKRLRIEKVVVLTTSQNFSVERFNSRIPALLQTYRTTLNTLHLDVKCIGPLMSYGLCLPNVTEFKIFMISARLEPTAAVVRLLKAFDFTRSLPALTKVDIINNHLSSPYGHIENFIEQGNAVLRELMPDRATNIKHLCVTDYLSHQTAPFLSETFPSVEILSVKEIWRSTFLCEQIWNHWTHLKTIDVKINAGENIGGRVYEHIDSQICGIFPEEVAELRGKHEEFLKTVNIVPVMPSIGCFNDLRTFRLTYFALDDHGVNNNLLCSKVTGLLVFARCPNLSVTIYNNLPGKEVQKALDHMKPYASVTLRRFTPGEIYELELQSLTHARSFPWLPLQIENNPWIRYDVERDLI